MIFNTNKTTKDTSSIQELSAYNKTQEEIKDINNHIGEINNKISDLDRYIETEENDRKSADNHLSSSILEVKNNCEIKHSQLEDKVDTFINSTNNNFSTLTTKNASQDVEIEDIKKAIVELDPKAAAVEEANKVREELKEYKEALSKEVITDKIETSLIKLDTIIPGREITVSETPNKYSVIKCSKLFDYFARGYDFFNADIQPFIIQWKDCNYLDYISFDNDNWYFIISEFGNDKRFSYYISSKTDYAYPIEIYDIDNLSELPTKPISVGKNGVYINSSVNLSQELRVISVDKLPEQPDENVIYIVKDDKSYFYDGTSYKPMSLDIDITTGHITKGKLDENLIYPAVQYTVDNKLEAFPGTFYDASIIESEQIPTGTKLIYVDENNMIKFSPEYLISGTKYGTKENVEANKATFDNIQWLTKPNESFSIPNINSTDWDISENKYGYYTINNFTEGPEGVNVHVVINGQRITGQTVYDESENVYWFNKIIKGTVKPDGTVEPDENGDILHFVFFVYPERKQGVVYLYSVNMIQKVGTLFSNTISGTVGTGIGTSIITIPLADFIYKTEALTITNESGKSFSVGSQKVQSFVDYKQNSINAILDERSAYNNLMVSQIETILSEDVDFDKIIN